MKKITTVILAMLLLTLSVLAASADQEGNARWCNIDKDGCYLIEADGSISYMYFWTEAARLHYMGDKTAPYTNVVPRYYSSDNRHPLEPAPTVIPPAPPLPMIDIVRLLRELLPNGIALLNNAVLIVPEKEIDGALIDFHGTDFAEILKKQGIDAEVLVPVFSMAVGESLESYDNSLGLYLMETEGNNHLNGSSSQIMPTAIQSSNGSMRSGVLLSNLNTGSGSGHLSGALLLGYVSAQNLSVSANIYEHDSGESGGSQGESGDTAGEYQTTDLDIAEASQDGKWIFLHLGVDRKHSGDDYSGSGGSGSSGDGSIQAGGTITAGMGISSSGQVIAGSGAGGAVYDKTVFGASGTKFKFVGSAGVTVDTWMSTAGLGKIVDTANGKSVEVLSGQYVDSRNSRLAVRIKEESSGTASWYGFENIDSYLPPGTVLGVKWYAEDEKNEHLYSPIDSDYAELNLKHF